VSTRPPALERLLREALDGEKRPAAFVLAGHNGSGKSTLWYERLASKLEMPLVNADRLTASILPPVHDTSEALPKWARQLRDEDERWQTLSQEGVRTFVSLIMERRIPFAFETVFSHWVPRADGTYESKAEIIELLQKQGYFVVLLFVGLASVDLSILRVETRKEQGGHGVPLNKLKTRFARTQKAVGHAAPLADMTLMFDNSRKPEEAFTLVRAQRGENILYDCRDKTYEVNANLVSTADIWLQKVVGEIRWSGNKNGGVSAMATAWKYLPILKWKQGERLALKNLSFVQWGKIIPLIELPAIVAAPNGDSLRAALPAYLAKIAKEFKASIPDDKPLVIDSRYVSPGYPNQSRLLGVICHWLVKNTKRQVFPVLTQAIATSGPVELAKLQGFDEYLFRILTPVIDSQQIKPLVSLLTAAKIEKNQLHLVVDQYSIVNEDPKVRFTMVRPYIDAAIASKCASTTLAGGSFPLNLIGIKQGTSDLPRVEWAIWKALRKIATYDAVRYGDYTVTNPAPVPEMDPKMLNPSVAIRYATDNSFRLFKAGGFKNGKPNQYQSLCKFLLSDAAYSGATFSFGDECYDKAASAKLGNGNPSSWRKDATNHHLVLTAASL
jgi:predicted ABC-type ATPase